MEETNGRNSEKEIAELTTLVDRWNKQWSGIGSPGLSQDNGSSSANGSKLDDKLIGIHPYKTKLG